jgi:hypothetical protein
MRTRSALGTLSSTLTPSSQPAAMEPVGLTHDEHVWNRERQSFSRYARLYTKNARARTATPSKRLNVPPPNMGAGGMAYGLPAQSMGYTVSSMSSTGALADPNAGNRRRAAAARPRSPMRNTQVWESMRPAHGSDALAKRQVRKRHAGTTMTMVNGTRYVLLLLLLPLLPLLPLPNYYRHYRYHCY